MVIRVFLLDDHEVVRAGIRRFLEAEEDLAVVGEAGTARATLDSLARLEVDVAVLDVRLSDGDGIEVCRRLRSAHPGVACLIFTSYADDEALTRAVLAGAAGYVLKQIQGHDLVDAIRAVATGRSLLDTADVARALEGLRRSGAQQDAWEHLTPREREIVTLIASGLTNREIGAQLFLAEKTVKNYVSALLAKLGMAHRSQAAAYAARLAERRARAASTSAGGPG